MGDIDAGLIFSAAASAKLLEDEAQGIPPFTQTYMRGGMVHNPSNGDLYHSREPKDGEYPVHAYFWCVAEPIKNDEYRIYAYKMLAYAMADGSTRNRFLEPDSVEDTSGFGPRGPVLLSREKAIKWLKDWDEDLSSTSEFEVVDHPDTCESELKRLAPELSILGLPQ